MTFIRLVNDTPTSVTLAQLRAENPNWSPPSGAIDRVLEKRGVYRVTDTQGLPGQIRDGFEQVDGVWQTKWRDKTAEEIASERARIRVTPYCSFRGGAGGGLVAELTSPISA